MKKLINLFLVIILLVGCSINPEIDSKGDVETKELEKVSDFSLFSNQILDYTNEYYSNTKSEMFRSADFGLKAADGAYSWINLDEDGGFSISLNIGFKDINRLPAEYEAEWIVAIVNTISMEELSVKELEDFIGATGKKYRSKEFNSNDELVNKQKGNYQKNENTLSLLIYKGYSGLLDISGYYDLSEDFFTTVENLRNSIGDRLEFDYYYRQRIEIEITKNNYLWVSMMKHEAEDIYFSPHEFMFL